MDCNGATSQSYFRIVRDLVHRHKPSVLGLVETRCRGEHANSIFRRIGFYIWIQIEALGYSGGIWLFWNAALNLSVIKTHPQFLHVEINKHGTSLWLVLTVVYASSNPTLRKLL